MLGRIDRVVIGLLSQHTELIVEACTDFIVAGTQLKYATTAS